MDYKTKPVSRYNIRNYAIIFRNLFDVPQTGSFPVLQALEKMSFVFHGSSYEVVNDIELPSNIPASCFTIGEDKFLIKIKESVYDGAYKGIGAYRDHILHEMSHIFLFLIGYKPISDRSFSNNEIRNYESVEWQAKALCGEIMMPYEETKFLPSTQIEKIYGVSTAQANFRHRY